MCVDGGGGIGGHLHNVIFIYCTYNGYMEFKFLLGVKVMYLIDKTDLFIISNLVLGGQAIVKDLYSSLE
jgi:hypothetical protein